MTKSRKKRNAWEQASYLAEKTPETCEAAIEYLRKATEEDLKWVK